MRSTLLATALFLTASAPLAAAHNDHGACEGTTLLGGTIDIDTYESPCTGVSSSRGSLNCTGRDEHFSVLTGGVHVLVLYGDGCQTGAVYHQRDP